jgi:uncharacterized protein (DUF1684 family)
MKSKINQTVFFLSALIFFAACNPQRKEEKAVIDTVVYRKEIEEWQRKRISNLKAENGWLNLVGLLWLKDGINTFGSDSKNDVVFPEGKIAPKAGYFLLKLNTVSVEASRDAKITFQGAPIKTFVMFHPDSSKMPMLESGSLRWNVIKRENKLGIRLRDLSHPDVQNFKGIDRYPLDINWRLNATYEASSGRAIDITNVLGQTTAQKCPGALVFKIGDVEYKLDVLEGGDDEFFVIFGDPTNTKETYGAGRYIYVKHPDANGQIVLDFNKAYNPPCAFTAFATCPLPPKQNILPIEVRAGEKNYGDYEHVKNSKDE